MSVEVKICGLTNVDDVTAALDEGADYVGFVLYARSSRGILPADVRAILERVRVPFRAVGVFVNATREWVETVAADCGLYAVQLHGDEDPETFAGYPGRLWRAVWTGARAAAIDPRPWNAERYVVDAGGQGVYGGSGVRADWVSAAALAAQYRILLAGGLTPENVAQAIDAVHPAGVDVSSGVEREPGRKDRAKLAKLIANAKR